MNATESPASGVDARGELQERLRQAERRYERAFAKACGAQERLDAAQRAYLAAGDAVRRLKLALLEGSKT
jgi:hypothetical protein